MSNSKAKFFRGLQPSQVGPSTNANESINKATTLKESNVNNIYDQIQFIKGNLQTAEQTAESYKTKYTELKTFNETLSKAYASNLQSLVSVSGLLHELHDLLKQMKKSMDVVTSQLIGVDTKDISYLEALTNDQITKLQDNFRSETNALKNIFIAYKQTDEAAQIDQARTDMNTVVLQASTLKKGGKTLKKKKKT